MIIGITGHRFWKDPEAEKKSLFDDLDLLIPQLKTKPGFAHGCAAGVDIWFGEYARINKFPLHLYPPFPIDIQVGKWSGTPEDEVELQAQLKIAKTVTIANEKFSLRGYGTRNRLLVDSCTVMLGYYVRERSGSGHASRYCAEIKRPFANIRKKEHSDVNFVLDVRKLRTNSIE